MKKMIDPKIQVVNVYSMLLSDLLIISLFSVIPFFVTCLLSIFTFIFIISSLFIGAILKTDCHDLKPVRVSESMYYISTIITTFAFWYISNGDILVASIVFIYKSLAFAINKVILEKCDEIYTEMIINPYNYRRNYWDVDLDK